MNKLNCQMTFCKFKMLLRFRSCELKLPIELLILYCCQQLLLQPMCRCSLILKQRKKLPCEETCCYPQVALLIWTLAILWTACSAQIPQHLTHPTILFSSLATHSSSSLCIQLPVIHPTILFSSLATRSSSLCIQLPVMAPAVLLRFVPRGGTCVTLI